MLKKSLWWAGLFCSMFCAGCISAPCPVGTVMDGNVCKRVQDGGAPSDDPDQRTDSAREPVASMSMTAANDMMTMSGSSRARKVGAAGSGASTNGANTGRDAGSATPSRAQTAGSGGSPSSGTSTTPAAGSGGGIPRDEDEPSEAPSTPPARDAGTQTDAPAGDWTCLNVDQSCTCVSGLGASGSCTNKPPCCFTLPSLMSCQCWPEEHENCSTFMDQDPNGKRVPTCPPP